MKKIFENQIKKAISLDDDVLALLSNKTYFNCDEQKIGDKVLIALIDDENHQEENKIALKVITLKEEHFDLFERYDDYQYSDNSLPRIKLKVK